MASGALAAAMTDKSKGEKFEVKAGADASLQQEKKIPFKGEDGKEGDIATEAATLEKGNSETETAEEPMVEGDASEEQGGNTLDKGEAGSESDEDNVKKRTRKVRKADSKEKSMNSGTKDGGRKSMSREMESITPLSDRPTRERKVVERYSVPDSLRSSASKTIHIEKGNGIPLKDIPNVLVRLTKKKVDDDLKSLHTILFGKKGRANMIKKNIGQFSGFVWTTNEEKQKSKVREKLEKCHKDRLLIFCDLLNIQRNRSFNRKEEIAAKIVDFLESPHISSDAVSVDSDKQSKKRKQPETKHSDSATPAKKKVSKSGEKSSRKVKNGDEEKAAELQIVVKPEAEIESQSEMKNDDAQSAYLEDDTEEEQVHNSTRRKNADNKKKTSSRSNKKPLGSSSKRSAPEISEFNEKKKRVSKNAKNGKGGSPTPLAPSKEKVPAKRKNPEKISEKHHGKNTGKRAKTEPTREKMHSVIVDILKEVDFNTATLSDILRQLSEHFSIDLMHRKMEVKEIITEVINSMSDEDDDQ